MKSIKDQAYELGISVSTLRAQLKRKKQEKELRKAEVDTRKKSAGWNPFAGRKNRYKG